MFKNKEETQLHIYLEVPELDEDSFENNFEMLDNGIIFKFSGKKSLKASE